VNLAFSTFLIVVLLVPGLIAVEVLKRRLVYPGAELPAPQSPFSTSLAAAILAAIVLHVLWAGVAWLTLHIVGIGAKAAPNLECAAMMLLGKYGANDSRIDEVIDGLSQHPIAMSGYLSVCTFFRGLWRRSSFPRPTSWLTGDTSTTPLPTNGPHSFGSGTRTWCS
jgi:hypothetical protein